jgi:hypothetical protein
LLVALIAVDSAPIAPRNFSDKSLGALQACLRPSDPVVDPLQLQAGVLPRSTGVDESRGWVGAGGLFAVQAEEVRWRGVIAGALEFVVTFSPVAGGGYTARLDIPAQGLSGGALTDVVYTATEIAFTLPIAPPSGAVWRASREAGATSAAGELQQGSSRVPFTMEMLAEGEEAGPARPQTPEPPFPYGEREVRYTNAADGTVLAGTLTIPDGAGPFPAALLISGSGPQNRDGELLGHKPFLVLADHLARHGVAALRLDDRGVGGSSGDIAAATSADFAGDVLAGVELLAGQPEVDAARIGLIGHSEGGIVAALAAARSEEVDWIVLMAAPGLPGSELMVMQLAAVQRSIGRPEANIERQIEVQRRLLALAAAGADREALREAVAELTAIQVAAMPAAQRPDPEELAPAIEAQAEQLMTPWWRFFLGHDPRQSLREVACPVLALNGSLDTQVPSEPNLQAIEAALRAGGNDELIVEELAGLNHLFQSARSGGPAEYAQIEETIAPAALERITAWILAR